MRVRRPQVIATDDERVQRPRLLVSAEDFASATNIAARHCGGACEEANEGNNRAQRQQMEPRLMQFSSVSPEPRPAGPDRLDWTSLHRVRRRVDLLVKPLGELARRRCATASAPALTSRISWVISAWRARFIAKVRLSISSAAFLDAFRIAVIRAPCSEAADSAAPEEQVRQIDRQ